MNVTGIEEQLIRLNGSLQALGALRVLDALPRQWSAWRAPQQAREILEPLRCGSAEAP